MRGALLRIPTVLLLVTIGAFVTARDDQVSPKVVAAVGLDAVDVLSAPDNVEAFRVDPREQPGPLETPEETAKKTIGGVRIIGVGKGDKELAEKLGKELLKERYYTGKQMRCFLPGVAYRFTRGMEDRRLTVDVVVCFFCTNFKVVVTDASGKTLKEAGPIGFGPATGDLLKLTKQAFPDDKEIQEIKAKE